MQNLAFSKILKWLIAILSQVYSMLKNTGVSPSYLNVRLKLSSNPDWPVTL